VQEELDSKKKLFTLKPKKINRFNIYFQASTKDTLFRFTNLQMIYKICEHYVATQDEQISTR